MFLLFENPNAATQTQRFIEEKGSVGLWRWNLATGEMAWSRGLFHLLETEYGSINPHFENFKALIHPHDLDQTTDLDLLLKAAGAVSRDFRIVLPNGRVRWFSSRGEIIVDSDGRPVEAIGLVLDVTKQYELYANAELLRTRFKQVLNVLRAVIWTATPDGQPADISGWCQLTNQPPREVYAAGWMDVIHADDREKVRKVWRRLIAAEDAFQLEFSVRTQDHRYRPVRSFVTPVRDAERILREWVILTMDIEPRPNQRENYTRADYLTGAQVRAARAILKWSVRDLAECANISPATIRRVEQFDGLTKGAESAVQAIKAVFEARRIEFSTSPDGAHNVRLPVRG